MPHVVTQPNPPFLSRSGALEVHQIPVLEDNFTYILVCTETGEAAAIDGPEAETVLAYCEAKGITLSAIFNTHTHWDHIGLNIDMTRRGLLKGMRVVGSQKVAGQVPGLTQAVADGDEIRLGKRIGKVILTEGHIKGHICFLFEDLLFSGDTLFAGGCGYISNNPPVQMYQSLQALGALDPDTKVCCAHEYTQDNLRFAYSVEPGNLALAERIRQVWALRAEGRATVPSRLQDELESNPFLRQGSPELVESLKKLYPKGDFTTPEGIFAATRYLKNQKLYSHNKPKRPTKESIS